MCRGDVEQPLHRSRFEAVGHALKLLRRKEGDVLYESHPEASLQRPQQAVVLAHRESELGADVCVHFKVWCVFYIKTVNIYKYLLQHTLQGRFTTLIV